jgi:hypothetical protein
MNTETNGSPVAEPEIQATDVPAQEVTPEVAAPESDEAAGRDDPDRAFKRMERRIGRVTEKRYQAEARAAQLEQELQSLRSQVGQTQPQEAEQRPDPRVLARELLEVEKATEKANSIASDGQKRYGKTFGLAVQTVAAEVGELFETSTGKPTPLGKAILRSPDPAALIHHLGVNPDVAADLADLDPIEQTWRLASIASDMSKPQATKQTQAPKPITPARAVTRDTGNLSNDLPMSEWAKRFYQQRQQRR